MARGFGPTLTHSLHWLADRRFHEAVERYVVAEAAHVRDYAAEQGVSEGEALKKGMEQKSVEFVKKGAQIYSKA